MRTATDSASDRRPARPGASLDSLKEIERAHERLWILAFVLFLLLTLGLSMVDVTSGVAERLMSGVRSTARSLVEHSATGLALVMIVLLVSAYFREKLALLRRENRELVQALDAGARILALRNHQLDTWDQLSHQLITNVNLPRLLELIVQTAAEVTESDCAAVILAERSGPHQRLAAIHRRGVHTELARRAAAKVIATGEAVCLSPDSTPDDLDRPDLAWEDVACLAASPFTATHGTSGALLVGRIAPATPYPAGILDVLGSFANQASIALEKAELYAENQRQLQRLAKLVDELRAIDSRSRMQAESASDPADMLTLEADRAKV